MDYAPPLQTINEPPKRPIMQSMRRGWACRCPSCGTGNLYHAYLKTNDACPACGEELHHHRADDAPPYFTIMIVGHVIIGGVLALERMYEPATWIHLLIWLPLTVLMSLWLLPRVKGALIGLQWALRMHGFDGKGADETEQDPAADIRTY
jgi:uncharacterized protein (DUF983 family)